MSTIIYRNEHPEIKKAFEVLSRVGLSTLGRFDVDIIKIAGKIASLEAQLAQHKKALELALGELMQDCGGHYNPNYCGNECVDYEKCRAGIDYYLQQAQGAE